MKEYKDAILKELNAKDAFATPKLEDTYVVLINGRRVILKNGCDEWSTIGSAKGSLTNYINYIIWDVCIKDYCPDDEYDLIEVRKLEIEIRKQWVKDHAQVVKYEDYMNVQRKRSQ